MKKLNEHDDEYAAMLNYLSPKVQLTKEELRGFLGYLSRQYKQYKQNKQYTDADIEGSVQAVISAVTGADEVFEDNVLIRYISGDSPDAGQYTIERLT